jgi:hypothetical protein
MISASTGGFSPENVSSKGPSITGEKNVLQASPACIASLSVSLEVDKVSEVESCTNSEKANCCGRKRELQGILKHESSYPRPQSVDDTPPIRLAETGVLQNYTRNKEGRVIALENSLFFANKTYELNAKLAVEKRKLTREQY